MRRTCSGRRHLAHSGTIGLCVLALVGCWSQSRAQSMDVRWHEGASDCAAASPDPVQVHAYEPRTYILRQNPCAHFEANFLYLLIGAERALLIDTGAVAEPERMPLATTVLELLPDRGESKIPLIAAHSHGHRDHRAGDAQFASRSSVDVVPVDVAGVRSFFGIGDWPNDTGRLDLGDRTVHVVPAPGHHPAHVVFYDERTGLVFSGDFLLPGRLLVADTAAYRGSAVRVVDFLDGRPVSHVLGGHIELDADGHLYPRGATHHPDERPLELSREHLLALPAALEGFNGFYARHEDFALSHPVHNLLALAGAAVVLLALVVWGAVRLLRRRRRTASEADG